MPINRKRRRQLPALSRELATLHNDLWKLARRARRLVLRFEAIERQVASYLQHRDRLRKRFLPDEEKKL